MSQRGSAFATLAGVHAKTADSLERIGFTKPFPVQSAVIPKAIRGRDLLVQAPTGSGKTLAFGVPIIEQLKTATKQPAALVLVPTRELAVQVRDELQLVARGKQLKVVAVFGGAPIDKQAMQVRSAAIVVATPGRLDDLLRNRRIDLTRVQTLVLDEADRMLDMGFQPQVDAILQQMPPQGQTMLFSATLEGPVAELARTYTSDADVVRTDRQSERDVRVKHEIMATTTANKIDTMMDVLDCERDLTVVFVRTQRAADRVMGNLRERGLRATAIHGGMSQAHRTREYNRFRDGVCEVLVATDVFARGMDVDRITLVLNYDLPEDADTYLHRAGRTGRAGREGTVVTMVMPKQRKQTRRMLTDAGQHESLVDDMRQPSGKHYKPLPFSERPEEKAAAQSSPARGKGEGNGIVVGFDADKGFGFIAPDTNGPDVFFHHKTISGCNPKSLRKGQRVSFLAERGERGERAKSVRVMAGWSGEERSGDSRNERKPASADARRGPRGPHRTARNPEGGRPSRKPHPSSQPRGERVARSEGAARSDKTSHRPDPAGPTRPLHRKKGKKRVPRVGPNGPNRAARRAHLQRTPS